MNNRAFWFIIKNNKRMTYDVIGPINNDDLYNAIVCATQKNGHEINCETSPDTCSRDDKCATMEDNGYSRDRSLFDKVRNWGV